MTESATERWLPIPGYEGFYEVSDLGRVRSLCRRAPDGSRRGGKMMTPIRDSDGYLRVKVRRDYSTKAQLRPVHQLVLLAFVGPVPPRQQVRHGPGGKLDNRLTNLYYGTSAKLTEQAVKEIRQRYELGERQDVLAHAYGVTQTCISAVVRRQWWRHV